MNAATAPEGGARMTVGRRVDHTDVADIRAVARRILRDASLEAGARRIALNRLKARAERTDVPQLAVFAIVAEVAYNIGRDDLEQRGTVPDAFERRQLALRRQDYARCPKCYGRLLTEADAWRMEEIRRHAREELERLEGVAS